MADSKRLRGWKWDANNTYIEVWVDGTEVARFDDATNDLTLLVNGLTIDAGGLTIATGGLTVSASGLDITGASTFADKVTYSGQLVHANATTQAVSADTILDVTSCGKVIQCATDCVEIVLPGTAAGATFTIVNTAADAGARIGVKADGADKIFAPDTATGDGSGMSNSKSSHIQGDMIQLVGDGDSGWYVSQITGTWISDSLEA